MPSLETNLDCGCWIPILVQFTRSRALARGILCFPVVQPSHEDFLNFLQGQIKQKKENNNCDYPYKFYFHFHFSVIFCWGHRRTSHSFGIFQPSKHYIISHTFLDSVTPRTYYEPIMASVLLRAERVSFWKKTILMMHCDSVAEAPD